MSMITLTRWERSKRTEAKRILQTAHQIAVYFYQINGFLVVPHTVNSTNQHHTVIFPDIEFTNIHNFWNLAKRINVDDPIVAPQDLLEEIAKLLPYKTFPLSHLQNAWGKLEEPVLKTIFDLIPDTKEILQTITIFPSQFGTKSSFNLPTIENPHMEIYLRYDSSIVNVAEAILTALTRDSITNVLKGTWAESEIIADWLITQSKLKDVLKDYIHLFQPTISITRDNQQTQLKTINDDFLKNLGFFPHHSLLSLQNESIYFNSQLLTGLTEKEHDVLKKLVEKGRVTTDEVAGILFTSEDNFSLYAIAKFIQRLRKKLELNGLTGSYIQTIRGYGYSLLA